MGRVKEWWMEQIDDVAVAYLAGYIDKSEARSKMEELNAPEEWILALFESNDNGES